jgi:virulence-associated protein VagC
MTARAKLFWTGRSQAVRLPKDFRFSGEEVLIRREGKAVVLEPSDDWPEGYFESWGTPAAPIKRLPQGRHERRPRIK